jgi:predicted secreted hydrolase
VIAVRLRPAVAAIGALALALGSAGSSAQSGGSLWKNVAPGYALSLPRDHVSHPAYKIEWWYYTGNVETDRGRRFGYQVTFFRVGVEVQPKNPSSFAVRDLFIAHIAVTDAAAKRYLSAERINRAGVGWAGASLTDYHVWNEDWEVRLDYGRHRLQARDPKFAIDLILYEDRPPVLHGDRGYSQKGTTPGNASEYYSLTRMPTEGSISVEGERFDVRGSSWMDHEFGSSFLEKRQQGWDWFSLQLEDGTDAMLFQLRGRDGSADPQSSGTMVRRDGTTRRLMPGDFALVPGRQWTSPGTNARYPVEWRVNVPGEGLDLAVRPVLDAQEMSGARTGVSYWEGAIEMEGTRNGKPITGRGYLEMTGYSGRALGEVLR